MALTGVTRRPVFGPSNRRAVHVRASVGRRDVLQLGIALPFLLSKPAFADAPAEVAYPVAELPAEPLASPPPASRPPKPAELYLDLEFQVVAPASFKFVNTQPEYDPNRRGPAPTPSPVRARFDSPDGSTVLSVIVRNAQAVKQTILQVSDISVYGSLEDVAKLLLPRGSRVLSASMLQVVLPPKQTALGPVEVPPKNYYRYEFTTTNGLHVAMSVAAMKGKVFVCGATTDEGPGWDQYGAALREATESFRLRSDNVVL